MDEDNAVAVAAAAFIIIYDGQKKRKSRRRCWTTQFTNSRKTYSGSDLLTELSVSKHFENFCRMSVQDFEFILNLISPRIQKVDTNYREAIPIKERLAVTLRFLATGDSYVSLMYLFKISKQSISTIIPEVCEALCDALKDYIKIPSSPEEWLEISEGFKNYWNFPNCIGAIDGKHIVLQKPVGSGSDYYNYKSFFSIVLFALVDAQYNFIFADVGAQGRISDGGIFKNTFLWEQIEKKALSLPEPKELPGRQKQIPYVLVGDDAFALHDNLMKPYSGLHSKGSRERIFNYRLSRARRVVENSFGILSAVYRVLRKPILLEPKKARVVVMTTLYLHNFSRRSASSANVYTPPGTLDTEENGTVTPGSWRQEDQPSQSLLPLRKIPRKSSSHAEDIRREIAEYFESNGKVSWQNNYA